MMLLMEEICLLLPGILKLRVILNIATSWYFVDAILFK